MSAAPAPRVRGIGGCSALELALEPVQEAGLRETLADLRHSRLDALVEAARAGEAAVVARHRAALDAIADLAGPASLTVAGPAPLVTELVRTAALTAAEALAEAVEPPRPPADLRELAAAASAWAATLAECTEVAP